jgi:ribonuclease HIII
MRFDWTGEKLQALSQEQLLNLLENLDRQRAIGRIPEGAAEGIDQRIAALLTKPNARRRSKALAAAAAGNEAKELP